MPTAPTSARAMGRTLHLRHIAVARRLLALPLVTLAVAACSRGDDTAERDREFLEGRDTVTVYETKAPTDLDDLQDEARRLAKVFDVQIEEEPSDPRNSGRSINILGQTQEWSFGREYLLYPSDLFGCQGCAPAGITAEDAITEAQRLWTELDENLDDWAWSSHPQLYDDNAPETPDNTERVVVEAHLIVDGIETSITSLFFFEDGGQLGRVNSSLRRPVPVSTAGMLTVAEAIAQESGSIGTDISVQADQATLVWDETFSRQTLRSFLIPMYQLPIGSTDPELGLSNTILAIRRQDLP